MTVNGKVQPGEGKKWVSVNVLYLYEKEKAKGTSSVSRANLPFQDASGRDHVGLSASINFYTLPNSKIYI